MIRDNLIEVIHEMEEVTKLFKLEPFDIYIIGGGACILGKYTTRVTLDLDFVDLGYPAKYGKVFVWLRDKEEYYFSVVDVIGALTNSNIPRNYWSDLKRKLKQEGSQLHENIVQLKMKAVDGKMRETDTLDTKRNIKYGKKMVWKYDKNSW